MDQRWRKYYSFKEKEIARSMEKISINKKIIPFIEDNLINKIILKFMKESFSKIKLINKSDYISKNKSKYDWMTAKLKF